MEMNSSMADGGGTSGSGAVKPDETSAAAGNVPAAPTDGSNDDIIQTSTTDGTAALGSPLMSKYFGAHIFDSDAARDDNQPPIVHMVLVAYMQFPLALCHSLPFHLLKHNAALKHVQNKKGVS